MVSFPVVASLEHGCSLGAVALGTLEAAEEAAAVGTATGHGKTSERQSTLEGHDGLGNSLGKTQGIAVA